MCTKFIKFLQKKKIQKAQKRRIGNFKKKILKSQEYMKKMRKKSH